MLLSRISLVFATATLLTSLGQAQVKVDPRLPKYEATTGVSGSVKSIGSDTLNNLMTLWTEGFRGYYPGVQIEVEGKGSSTAPPALIEGRATFGPMSREMKAAEVDEFEQKFGYKPVGIPVAIDLLAVYVHKDNPIKGLSLQQVDAIFSKTRRGGAPAQIVTWGDLGLEGEWADKPISLYGRNSASGTYGYFKKKALFGGDYRDTVKEQPGSSSVVSGIAGDRYAIGYSGIGYMTADVRAVPLSKSSETEYAGANADEVKSYPLARFLYVYLNYKPGSELEPLRREFARFVFSNEGQSVVLKGGYLPVNGDIAKRALTSVGLEFTPAPAMGKPVNAGSPSGGQR